MKSKSSKISRFKTIKKFINEIKVMQQLNYAVRKGIIEKEPCLVCGDTKKVHAHHDDYNKPLEVLWLCPIHHRQLHTNKNNAYKQYGNLLPTQRGGRYVDF